MDNSASKASRPSRMEAAAGHLRSTKRLEEMYQEIIRSKEMRKGMEEVLKTVRILVLGRSGCGKSTLIRLVMGDKGPRSISEGTAGSQDIDQEWHHPDPDMPVVFHDSNGMDLGKDRLAVIQRFLDERHRKKKEYSQKVHVVWYVFSAADTRVLDDGGLLELSDSYQIPLLFVMTFNDSKPPRTHQGQVTPSTVSKLLGRIGDPGKREKVRQSMVRTGNNIIREDGAGGTRLVVVSKDVGGLKEVIERTRGMIGEELEYTWVSCQVVDVDRKLELSAKTIVGYKRKEMFSTCAVGALPVAQQAQLGYMFFIVWRKLCTVWGVPPNMREALFKELYLREGAHCVSRNFVHNVVAGLGLVASLAASVVTGGAAVPAILVVMAAAGLTQLKATSTLLMSYSLMILGAILYIKSMNLTSETWDADKPAAEFSDLFREFVASDYCVELKDFCKEYQSSWETLTRESAQEDRLKHQLVGFFNRLMLHRPNSLFTFLGKPDPEDAAPSTAKHLQCDLRRSEMNVVFGNPECDQYPEMTSD